MKQVLRISLFLLAGWLALGQTYAAAPSEDLADLRKKINALKEELQANEANRSEAADALKTSEQAISEANRMLQQAESEQRASQLEVSRINIDIARARQTLNANRERLRQLLQARYRNGQHEALRLLLNRQDPNQLSRDLHYYRYIAEAQHKLSQELAAQLDKLNALAEVIRQKHEELQRLAEEKRKQRQSLAMEQAERKQVLSKLASEIGQQRKQINKLQADEQRLSNLMERLARLSREREAKETRERERQARAAQAAAEKASKQTSGKAASKTEGASKSEPAGRLNLAVPDSSSDGKAFNALKGSLRLPAKGEVVGKFGTTRAEGTQWKGVFIRTEAGQAVRAVSSGRVVFADWLRGFGNMLIIDHGGGYMTLYGAAESLLKQVGERVKAGEGIATSGNSGGSAETGIYFELRHLGRPIDPLSWAGK